MAGGAARIVSESGHQRSHWQVLDDPRLPLQLAYPAITPLGHRVEGRRLVTAQAYRLHLVSSAGGEVYFEVAVYPVRTAREAYEALRQAMQADTPAPDVGELTACELAGRAGWQFRVRWPDRERRITLIPVGDRLCRLIFDPVSPLNEQILATVSFT